MTLVFSAAKEKWLEGSSVSNLEIYQSIWLEARFRDETGKTQLLHTLNDSARPAADHCLFAGE